ncbi:MAG: DUF4129 domain-containing protein [Micrococcus sp.]|nr:DUF4129 domain-containing protein [Micrococcus sp.]
MTAPSAAARAAWQPERDEARRLLQEELAGREYAEAQPNPVLEWLGEAFGGLVEWVDSLGGGVPAFPGWVLLVIVVVAAVVVLLLVRPRANAARRDRRSDAVLADRSLAPGDHRRAAAAATAAGDHDAALTSWFRAVVRQAEVRTVLDDRPGRTATEAAHALAAAFPAEHGPLHHAASVFNAVVYGDRSATAAQAESVRALDARLQSAPAAASSPDGSGAGSTALAAPR